MSIKNTQERFKELVEKRDKLSSEKIQLETRKSVAQAELEKQQTQLKEEFGVEDLDSAKALLAEFESEIDSGLTECEEFLKKFED